MGRSKGFGRRQRCSGGPGRGFGRPLGMGQGLGMGAGGCLTPQGQPQGNRPQSYRMVDDQN